MTQGRLLKYVIVYIRQFIHGTCVALVFIGSVTFLSPVNNTHAVAYLQA